MKKLLLNEQIYQKFHQNPQQALIEFGIELNEKDRELLMSAKQCKNLAEFQNFLMKSRLSNFFEM